MNVCELTLAVSHPPTGQEQVPQDEVHEGCCDVFVRGLGPISYKAETLSEVKNGNYTLSLRFLRKIGGQEVKNIDLYILANSESIS